MKDQYFGDQTDYLKHSLLRQLAQAGVRLAIHWNRTPDDTTRDGQRTSYLSKPTIWRGFDPDVFDFIRSAVLNGERRLEKFEEGGFIPQALFCYDAWTSQPDLRKKSLRQFLEASDCSDLFFFDPDNGLEVAATHTSKSNLAKYVLFDELALVWEKNVDLLVYQHYPRVNRQHYIRHRFAQMVSRFDGLERAFVLSTSHAAFIFLPQKKSTKDIRTVFTAFTQNWDPHVCMFEIVKTEHGDTITQLTTQSNQRELAF